MRERQRECKRAREQESKRVREHKRERASARERECRDRETNTLHMPFCFPLN